MGKIGNYTIGTILFAGASLFGTLGYVGLNAYYDSITCNKNLEFKLIRDATKQIEDLVNNNCENVSGNLFLVAMLGGTTCLTLTGLGLKYYLKE